MTEPTFSAEVISCLLASLTETGVTVGAKHYKLMSQLDGSKTASGYEHLFRAVKKRAAAIAEQIKNGEIDLGAKDSSTKMRKEGIGPDSATRKRCKRNRDVARDDGQEHEAAKSNKKIKMEQSEGRDEDEMI